MNQRFSQFVVQQIRNGNYAIADSFLGPNYVVNKDRMDKSPYGHIGWADEMENNDEWSLYLHSWLFGLFPRVNLIRGPEHYSIRLTRHEHRGLAIIFRAIFAAKKDVAKQKKMEYKIAQENAYYVNGVPQLEVA